MEGKEKPGGLEIHSVCFQTARVLSLLAGLVTSEGPAPQLPAGTLGFTRYPE